MAFSALSKNGSEQAADGTSPVSSDASDTASTPIKKLFPNSPKDTFDEGMIHRAIKEVQQSLLLHADSQVSAIDSLKRREADKKQEVSDSDTYPSPGCFVVATYAKFDFDKDLTDYLGIYIGKTVNIGDGIEGALSTQGNPDLYADMKYRQNVQIYLFTCREKELDTKYDLLLEALQSDRSYN